MNRINIDNVEDLKCSARHQIGDIKISIIQGDGCYGSRDLNTFEVMVWDSNGDIPLSHSGIGSHFRWDDIKDLFYLIRYFDRKRLRATRIQNINKMKLGVPITCPSNMGEITSDNAQSSFANYQRHIMYPKTMELV